MSPCTSTFLLRWNIASGKRNRLAVPWRSRTKCRMRVHPAIGRWNKVFWNMETELEQIQIRIWEGDCLEEYSLALKWLKIREILQHPTDRVIALPSCRRNHHLLVTTLYKHHELLPASICLRCFQLVILPSLYRAGHMRAWDSNTRQYWSAFWLIN